MNEDRVYIRPYMVTCGSSEPAEPFELSDPSVPSLRTGSHHHPFSSVLPLKYEGHAPGSFYVCVCELPKHMVHQKGKALSSHYRHHCLWDPCSLLT